LIDNDSQNTPSKKIFLDFPYYGPSPARNTSGALRRFPDFPRRFALRALPSVCKILHSECRCVILLHAQPPAQPKACDAIYFT
jgi:hypothetical protein